MDTSGPCPNSQGFVGWWEMVRRFVDATMYRKRTTDLTSTQKDLCCNHGDLDLRSR